MFREIAAGLVHGCGLEEGGSLRCWGVDCASLGIAPEQCPTTPPSGSDFVEVASGEAHLCARRASGEIVCWGYGEQGESTAPAGAFSRVAAGQQRSCGVRSDGTVECWGRPLSDTTSSPDPPFDPRPASTSPPTGVRFSQLAVGRGHVCGIGVDAMAVCWGGANFGGARLDPVPYAKLAAGRGNTCGIQTGDGALHCSGKITLNFPTPVGRFLDVAVSEEHACAVTLDGEVLCWGDGTYGETEPPPLPRAEDAAVPPELPLMPRVTLDASGDQACGLNEDGDAACWGDAGEWAGSERYARVSVGAAHVCLLTRDGRPECSVLGGSDPFGEPGSAFARRIEPPPEVFVEIAAGRFHSCGLKPDGKVACWGAGTTAGDCAEPRFECGQAIPPPDRFLAIDAGFVHTCGVREDRSVLCWGALRQGVVARVPGDFFESVAVGAAYTCGIRSDRTLNCWGDGGGAGIPPTLPLDDFSIDTFAACGIRTSDGHIECWNLLGASDFPVPPTGTFQKVAIGQAHGCALGLDRVLRCWGQVAGSPPVNLF